jgi:hypothetical protein
MWMSSTFLTAARSQRPNWRRCWIFLFGGDVAGLSVAIRYRTSKCYEPTRNLVTIIESFLWWLFVGIMLSRKISNQMVILMDFSSLWTPYENRRLRSTQPNHWGRLLFHWLKTYQVILLFETLPTYHFVQVFSRLFDDSLFLPTFSQSEGTCDSRVAIDHFQWPLLGRYTLNSIVHLIQWIHLVHLRWHSVDHQEAPHCGAGGAICYLDKSSLSIYGPLGCLCLSFALPCRERRPIARLVSFLLTFESMQS